MKKGKIKILLLALTMLLSTFASGMTFEDFEGNDEYSYKVDPPKSTTFYFDEDGDKVDGPTEFWVKFVLSGDELSFITNNLTLDLLSIKGGPNYRVYSDLGSSGSGLTAPINPNNDEPYGISHYSFELDLVIPPPEPEGEIEIEKIVIDEDEDVILDDETKFYFKIEISDGDGGWDEIKESPVTITGNDTKKIDGLPMGEYRVTEYDIHEDYDLVGDNGVLVELEEDGDKAKVEFTNMKEDDTTPPDLGQITVEKIVQNRSGNTMSSSIRFYFVLEMLVDDDWDEVDDGSILGNGTLIFDGLEDGDYRVREVDIDTDFFLVSSNNQLVEIEEGSSEEAEFVNRLRPLPPDDDDDDDRPRPRPEPEPEPEEEEEEVLEVTVVEEPVPEAPPVIVVVEEAVPLATLPATGASDPLLLSGLGTALLGLGLLIKKRR